MSEVTPLMKQYFHIKQQYQETLLLFQVGDFYELFFDDAKRAAAYLGIALTKRGNINGQPIPLCGVPVHALDHYLMKLIKGGFKVAICNQLEEPKPGKVVDRGVTQVLTPGTLTDSRLLDEKSASFLFSFFPAPNAWGLVFAELLTAQLFATMIPTRSERILEGELIRFFPDEIIVPNIKDAKPFENHFKKLGYVITPISADDESPAQAQQWMRQQFSTDINNQLMQHNPVQDALTYFHSYLAKTQQEALGHFKSIHFYESDDFLILDAATQANLELVRNKNDGTAQHTLFQTLDGALTPMGSRMVKKWIMRPLVAKPAIEQRQDVVECFLHDIVLMQKMEQLLAQLGDLERIIGRIALRRGSLHDYVHIQKALARIPDIVNLLQQKSQTPLVAHIYSQIGEFDLLHQLLSVALNDDFAQSWVIKPGFDFELDRTRELAQQGAQKIIELEVQEQEATKISSLKIRYNNMFGYYIEVTNTHKNSIPERYIRQQTLVGRERYTTIELRHLEQEISQAKATVESLEAAVFERIKQEVATFITPLRKFAHAIAHLDALLGLARIAYAHQYVRPQFNEQRVFEVQQSRHPVIERIEGHTFIPNDITLNDAHASLIITGPNMGGKSTYLRQVALTSIMAQVGSHVPARKALLPIVDRVFTRIGAGDNLAQGKSTFLVEMEETASICTQATENSLVILDEVGRGTSTYDGLALAQAVVEYIHTVIKARCLFATHYQELTLLEQRFAGIANYHAASTKSKTGILFLYKILPGIAQGSFGIEVAKIAQLPKEIIKRAEVLLHELDGQPAKVTTHASVTLGDDSEALADAHEKIQILEQQLQQQKNALQHIAQIDYDNLSPRQAFDLVWKFKEFQH